MKRKYGNLDEAVNFISTKMALKKVKREQNDEKEFLSEQDNLKALLVEKNKNEGQVKDHINAIYNTIIKENPSIDFPQDFLIDVANFVAVEVEEKGIVNPEQISITSIKNSELLKNIIQGNDFKGAPYYQKQNEIISGVRISSELIEKYERSMKEILGNNFFTIEEIKQTEENVVDFITNVGEENLEDIIKKANSGDFEKAKLLILVQDVEKIKNIYPDINCISDEEKREYLEKILMILDFKEKNQGYSEIIDTVLKQFPNEGENVSLKEVEKQYKLLTGQEFNYDFYVGGINEAAKLYISGPENQFENVEDLKNSVTEYFQAAQVNKSIKSVQLQEMSNNSLEKYIDNKKEKNMQDSEYCKYLVERLPNQVQLSLENDFGNSFLKNERIIGECKYNFRNKESQKIMFADKEKTSKEIVINAIKNRPEIGKALIERYIKKYNETHDDKCLVKINELKDILSSEVEKDKRYEQRKEEVIGKLKEINQKRLSMEDDDNDAR